LQEFVAFHSGSGLTLGKSSVPSAFESFGLNGEYKGSGYPLALRLVVKLKQMPEVVFFDIGISELC